VSIPIGTERTIMKRIILFVSTITFLFGATTIGCGPASEPCCDEPVVLRDLSPEELLVVESSNNFAFDIFQRTSELEDNMFISPFSISTALAMTANGAAGETKETIKTAIYLSNMTDEEMNRAYSDLAGFLLHLDGRVVLELANSSWYREDLTVEEVFRNVLLEYYDAEIRSANFADPATKDIINGWIEDKTHDKIKNMIDQIPPDVVMYLINAIYFKADWKYQFDETKTKPADFYLENGNTVETDMMYCKGVKIDYFYNNNFFFMMIPYGNGQYTMTVMMPMHETPIQEIINETSVYNFRDFSLAADTATVELYMPKFKLKYKKLLNDVLADMGIAFGGGADLSNLFVDALDLFISRVIHQSFIEINEKGSEAAAATVVEISETSVGPGGPPEVVFVDRPFAFFITEKHSNTILFAGKITDPTRLE